uniref:Uncharacterized protein n=1 Tax=Onchocerca volvulus TaxID=6282 RepID=A0A8R1Y6M8_ONCVO
MRSKNATNFIFTPTFKKIMKDEDVTKIEFKLRFIHFKCSVLQRTPCLVADLSTGQFVTFVYLFLQIFIKLMVKKIDKFLPILRKLTDENNLIRGDEEKINN